MLHVAQSAGREVRFRGLRVRGMWWFDFKVPRVGGDQYPVYKDSWHVYLVDRVPVSGTGYGPWAQLDGVTDFKLQNILVCAKREIPIQNETVFHELMHVSYGPKGALTKEHERQVGRMSPVLYATLKQLCMASWPRRPRGWQCLRGDDHVY
jgi:hypothetical protein